MINKNNRVLITGCGGMLGEAVYAEFKDKCLVYATDIDLNESWLTHLDVSSAEEAKKCFEKIKPDFVVHLAALTDMEYCENHPKHAYDVNGKGTENLLKLSRQKNIPFVYISTAGIFDGKKDSYTEEDLPNPLSIYAKSKYVGEVAAKSYRKSIIIRAGWMIGGGPAKDKKFVNKIIKQLKSGAVELAVVNDKMGTPTYTYDLAKVIWELLSREAFGLYHGVCRGAGGSRYDVAKVILSSLGLKNKILLKEVDSEYFKDSYFAPRPSSEKLLDTKLEKLGINVTRKWEECLGEYIKKFDWDFKA